MLMFAFLKEVVQSLKKRATVI